jgi:beta-lactamase class D
MSCLVASRVIVDSGVLQDQTDTRLAKYDQNSESTLGWNSQTDIVRWEVSGNSKYKPNIVRVKSDIVRVRPDIVRWDWTLSAGRS